MKKRQQQPGDQQQQQQKGREHYSNYQQYQCNKGKTCKFKRSGSNLEEDGASSAILFLACIACIPSN